MRVAAKLPSDQQLCFEHKQVSLSVQNETCWRVTARNSLQKKRRYLHCCQPDESCQRQSLGLQPASPHILRCPDRYHRCTSTGEGGTLELLYTQWRSLPALTLASGL